MKPQKVDSLDLAFGGDMKKLLPDYATIPDEFKRGYNPWNKFFSKMFFGGLSQEEFDALKPLDGVNKSDAFRHIRAIACSFEPKHEHKEAGCAYLFSLWFEPLTAEKGATK